MFWRAPKRKIFGFTKKYHFYEKKKVELERNSFQLLHASTHTHLSMNQLDKKAPSHEGTKQPYDI